MRPKNITTAGNYETSLEINRVLRNTYLLLSMTLIVSAATSWFAMATNAQQMNIFVALIGMFGLSFLTRALRNSAWGLVSIFAFTAFMGYMIGPMLNFYIKSFSNGTELIGMALGCTGLIFLTLSGYTIATKKNFDYMAGFICIASMVLFVGILGSIFFNMPLMYIIISGGISVISSAFILYTTSSIIRGGERNYIMATIDLYVSIFNLFVSLLNIFGALAGNRN